MRVAIQTLGTRGDVQPYIALALGLMRKGHEVQIAAPVQFDAMVRGRGIPFAPLPAEFLALMDTREGKAALAGGRGFRPGLKLLKHFRPLMRSLLDAERAAVRQFMPDIIIHHPKSLASPHMGEALARPCILASPLPGFTPTSAFPSPLLPFGSLGPLNRVSHSLAIRGAGWLFGGMIRQWRQEVLGLPRRSHVAVGPSGTLYAYSRHVVPVPPDWDRDVLVSGYWFLDSDYWEIPADVAAFLDSGEPPIYVGFGSMPGLDPQRMTEMVIEALAKTGKRGVLATGGGALAAADVPAHVHVLTGAPHDKLFPRMAAVVHHGGAGTTAAAIRAGKPMTICPFFGDQPFWGRRIVELGAGPPPLDRKTLTVERLAAAIAAMGTPGMRRQAAALGEAVRQEDGVAQAVEFIERIVLSRVAS
ncbi:MAG TPA: glycosyltransferase [Microvirga sp.]|nr:glycosyltransferase [Microvirga sp.]